MGSQTCRATRCNLRLLSHYNDRCIDYQERNRGHLDASTLALITDDNDQAKFCVPRHLPASKRLQDSRLADSAF
eukprot:6147765-Alexandrium_andersonii.AAC.1